MNAASTPKVLVIGYGNPGRLDDGLGPAVAELVAAPDIAGVTVETGYQLELQDAALAAEHEHVVFVDAERGLDEPFHFRSIEPGETHEFTTHALSPETVLGVAHSVLGARTQGWVLGVRGEEFDAFGEKLSHAAEGNRDAAAEFLTGLLRSGMEAACATREG